MQVGINRIVDFYKDMESEAVIIHVTLSSEWDT